jgi:hypothetical protein
MPMRRALLNRGLSAEEFAESPSKADGASFRAAAHFDAEGAPDKAVGISWPIMLSGEGGRAESQGFISRTQPLSSRDANGRQRSPSGRPTIGAIERWDIKQSKKSTRISGKSSGTDG